MNTMHQVICTTTATMAYKRATKRLVQGTAMDTACACWGTMATRSVKKLSTSTGWGLMTIMTTVNFLLWDMAGAVHIRPQEWEDKYRGVRHPGIVGETITHQIPIGSHVYVRLPYIHYELTARSRKASW